jgi:hypothetical protein
LAQGKEPVDGSESTAIASPVPGGCSVCRPKAHSPEFLTGRKPGAIPEGEQLKWMQWVLPHHTSVAALVKGRLSAFLEFVNGGLITADATLKG